MILAFDCTFETTSVAVLDGGGRLMSFKSDDRERSQTEILMPLIKGAMEEAGVSFKELTKIAVTKGPGSFTGVRIGLASAQGLSFASNVPLVGVSALEAVAFKAEQPDLCVVLETKRDDFYVQTFKYLNPISTPYVADARRLKDMRGTVFAGNGVGRLQREIGPVRTYPVEMPDAKTIALLAMDRPASFDEVEPLYLREAEVHVKCT